MHNDLELVKNGQDLLFFYVDGESVKLGACECLDEQCVPCEGPGKVFEADSETCEYQNVCTCENGSGTVGELCPTDGGVMCAACDTGYELVADFCTINQFTCQNGLPEIENCEIHLSEICESCNPGYYLNSTGVDCIAENVCSCEHGSGTVGEQCPTDGVTLCAACDTGYELISGSCISSICVLNPDLIRCSAIAMGCWNDNQEQLILNDGEQDMEINEIIPDFNTQPHGHLEYCFSKCQDHGTRYAGLGVWYDSSNPNVAWSFQCFCSDSFGSYGPADITTCQIPCRDANSDACGGGFKNLVYEIPSKPTDLSTTTEQETTTLEATTTHAPTITNAQQGMVYDVLIEAGVNNLAKQLAVTLTWENDCDLNLHVWEPSGEEISDLDYNYGDSSTGGNLYLENISWDTAPFGDYTIAISSGCDTDEDPVYGSYGYDTIEENDSGGFPTKSISYSLFVWIDGETTVLNRTTMPTLSTYDVVSLTFDSASEHVINEILPSKRHFYNGADSYEDYYSNYGPYGK